jgi:hypothetical protein
LTRAGRAWRDGMIGPAKGFRGGGHSAPPLAALPRRRIAFRILHGARDHGARDHGKLGEDEEEWR